MAYSASETAKASLLGLIFVVNFVGNVLVAYILIKHKRFLLTNRPTYQFILNIILSDLVVGVLTIPFELVRELLGSWIFGETLCKIVEFIEIAVSGTAVFTHALIAVDRYRSLAHPHLPKFRGKLTKQLIAMSWIVPAVSSSPYIYMFEIQERESKIICTPKAIPVEWLDRTYEGLEFAVVLLIPFCVLCWCYFLVSLKMWGILKSRQISAASFFARRSVILRTRKNITRTTCLVTGVFIVCFIPTFVLSIIRILSGTDAIYRGHVLYEISMFGTFINEALNPVIYCTYDRNVKSRANCSCVGNGGDDFNVNGEQTFNTTGTRQNALVTTRTLDRALSKESGGVIR